MFYWKNLRNFVDMKSSIDFLPERKQRDLYELVGLIRDEVKDVVMIILYGSYARNTYVELDIQRDYGGGKIQFMSDYDILVVTKRRLGSRESTVNSRIKDRFLRDKGEFQIYRSSTMHFPRGVISMSIFWPKGSCFTTAESVRRPRRAS